MKSLNKTLSLVLVLVMVLGLFGAAGAAFKDQNEVGYTEAVNVISGIGAINGYEDGSFKPTGTISREEAAKMVTYAILGSNLASKLSVTSTGFTDVSSDRWSAPYISYCVSRGIINGMGDGSFDPTGEVTGYQIAKMLLCAIGYGKRDEYVGNSWELNTAIDANKYGVFAGSKAAVYSQPATREETTLYVFNALTGNKAVQVDYDKTRDKYDSTGNKTIGDELYNLKSVNNSFDDFGRPASVWTFGQSDKKISAVIEKPVVTFTKGFTSGELYKALGVAASDITVITNSENAQTNSDKISSVKNGSAQYADNGIITEIYKTSNTPSYLAVQIIPSFAKLDNVSSTKASSIKGAFDTYTIGSLSGDVFTSVVDAQDDVDTAIIKGEVSKGDMVLYYQDGEGNLYIEAAGTISGMLTSINYKGIVTIDDVQTEKAAAFTGDPLAINVKQEQSFYVDSFGYILGVKKAAAESAKIAMVLGTDSFSEIKDGKLVTSYSAVIADLEGAVTTVSTDKDSFDLNLAGTVCDYSISSTGVYSFVASSEDVAVSSITNNSAVLNAGTLYANSLTKFVVVDYKTDEKGLRVPAGTVSVYTGIANAPSFPTLSKTFALDLLPVGSPDEVAEVVYIFDDVQAASSDSYVYVIGSYTQTAAGYVYDTIVKGQAGTITVSDNTSLNAKTLYSEIKLTGTTVTVATAATTNIDKVGNVGGLLFTSDSDNYGFAGKTISNDVPVFTINTTTSAVTVSTGADLSTPAVSEDAIHIVYSSANPNAVAAIYIVVA
jgi:hypothetical protein